MLQPRPPTRLALSRQKSLNKIQPRESPDVPLPDAVLDFFDSPEKTLDLGGLIQDDNLGKAFPRILRLLGSRSFPAEMNNAVEIVNLSNNNIDSKQLLELIGALKAGPLWRKPSSLKKLVLTNNALTPDAIDFIVDAVRLGAKTALEVIDLQGNPALTTRPPPFKPSMPVRCCSFLRCRSIQQPEDIVAINCEKVLELYKNQLRLRRPNPTRILLYDEPHGELEFPTRLHIPTPLTPAEGRLQYVQRTVDNTARLTPGDVFVISRLLLGAAGASIKHINITNLLEDPASAHILALALKHGACPNLETLTLNSNRIGDTHAKLLSTALAARIVQESGVAETKQDAPGQEETKEAYPNGPSTPRPRNTNVLIDLRFNMMSLKVREAVYNALTRAGYTVKVDHQSDRPVYSFLSWAWLVASVVDFLFDCGAAVLYSRAGELEWTVIMAVLVVIGAVVAVVDTLHGLSRKLAETGQSLGVGQKIGVAIASAVGLGPLLLLKKKVKMDDIRRSKINEGMWESYPSLIFQAYVLALGWYQSRASRVSTVAAVLQILSLVRSLFTTSLSVMNNGPVKGLKAYYILFPAVAFNLSCALFTWAILAANSLGITAGCVLAVWVSHAFCWLRWWDRPATRSLVPEGSNMRMSRIVQYFLLAPLLRLCGPMIVEDSLAPGDDMKKERFKVARWCFYLSVALFIAFGAIGVNISEPHSRVANACDSDTGDGGCWGPAACTTLIILNMLAAGFGLWATCDTAWADAVEKKYNVEAGGTPLRPAGTPMRTPGTPGRTTGMPPGVLTFDGRLQAV